MVLEWRTLKSSEFSATPSITDKMNRARVETLKSPKSVRKCHFREIVVEPQVLNKDFWEWLDLVAYKVLVKEDHWLEPENLDVLT